MKKNPEIYIFYSFVFLLVSFIYYPILTSKIIIDNDYSLIIAPLQNIHSFKDYFLAILSNKVFDIQPIRDLSLICALKISEWLKLPRFIIYYNFGLWLLSLTALHGLLNKLNFNKWSRAFIICLIAVHPVFSQVIPWMSAHKHLLAFFLTLISLNYYFKFLQNNFKNKNDALKSLAFYTLAIFTQPIIISIPLWLSLITFFKYSDNNVPKQLKSLLLTLLSIMFLGIIINLWYYSGPYAAASQSYKFLTLGITERLLSLGRYFIQIIFPVSFARTYYYGSTLNIVGLLLMPLVFMIFNRVLGRVITITWGALFFFPLVMMNIRSTNVFVSDTYLLLPSIGLIILIYLTVEKLIRYIPFPKHYKLSFFILIISVLTIQARVEARHWIEPMTFVKVSYEREKSCINLLNYATYLWRFPDLRKTATRITQEMVVQPCQFKTVPSLFFSESRNAIIASVYFTEDLTLDAKINILKQSQNPYSKLFLANLYLKKGQDDKALKLINEVFQTTKYVFLDLRNDPALNELDKFCDDKSTTSCTQVKMQLDKIKPIPNASEQVEPEDPEAPSHPDNLK